jgi:phosphoglycolate phosphatase
MNFIFDFDGTIADSFSAVLDIASDIGADMGLQIDKSKVDDYRKMSSLQVIRHFRIPLWKLPRLLKEGMREFKNRVPDIQTFTGLPQALAALQKRGDSLYMLTSNNAKNVDAFLKQTHMAGHFTHIYTGSSLFGKAAHLKRIVREQGLVRSETLYVGDETRDIQAAKRAGLRVASVTWGFNHETVLLKYHPTYLIHKPSDLLDIK